MQLEQIAAVVRPRRPWEAVDLGFQMARAWWGPIVRCWLMIVAPFFFAVVVALQLRPLAALAVVWWCKPLYDRVPLYVLSRALFGNVPRAREVRSKMPRLWLAQSLGALTVLRLDPLRAFVMPVGRLEGLHGKEYRERLAVLKRDSVDAFASSWLTLACLLFELAALLAIVALLDVLRPEEFAGSFWEVFTFVADSNAPPWYYFFAMTLYFVAMTLIEPFYVGGGFALYLNRRTQLEGWDVELAFRRLAQRLAAGEPPRSSMRRKALKKPSPARKLPHQAAVLLLAAGILSSAPAGTVRAQEAAPERDPEEAVQEILEDPEFGTHRTVRTWRLRYEPEVEESEPSSAWVEFLQSLGSLLALVLKFLLWGSFIVAFAFLVVALWRHVGPTRRERRRDEDAGSIVVAGLDISSQALPDDIVRAAMREWAAGRPDEALSLLYRGALAWLVTERRMPAKESWTEGDCLRHLEGPTSPVPPGSSLVRYFSRLTASWLQAAYAHRPPSDDEIRQLTDDWPKHFRPTFSGGRTS